MYSQASKNARQRPKLTSPSANIAGSQTNKFIDPSEAAPQGKTTALPRAKSDGRAATQLRWREASSSAGKRAIPIGRVVRKEFVRMAAP
jgi:hypothetical protein